MDRLCVMSDKVVSYVQSVSGHRKVSEPSEPDYRRLFFVFVLSGFRS